jgi:hypothetical protein
MKEGKEKNQEDFYVSNLNNWKGKAQRKQTTFESKAQEVKTLSLRSQLLGHRFELRTKFL